MKRTGLFLLELQAQQIGKKMVVTKPLATIVQTNQEQVRTIELLQHLVTTVIAGERVAKRPVQTCQNRSSQKKVLRFFSLAVEHFLQQVIQNKAVVAGKIFHQFRTI